jgi:hypothetical protein
MVSKSVDKRFGDLLFFALLLLRQLLIETEQSKLFVRNASFLGRGFDVAVRTQADIAPVDPWKIGRRFRVGNMFADHCTMVGTSMEIMDAELRARWRLISSRRGVRGNFMETDRKENNADLAAL